VVSAQGNLSTPTLRGQVVRKLVRAFLRARPSVTSRAALTDPVVAAPSARDADEVGSAQVSVA
jgi:hypothetical protein